MVNDRGGKQRAKRHHEEAALLRVSSRERERERERERAFRSLTAFGKDPSAGFPPVGGGVGGCDRLREDLGLTPWSARNLSVGVNPSMVVW